MKTVTSISGGMTSAYLSANYSTDYNIFSLVTTSDKNCIYPDKKLRQVVSDKIGREFVGTLEDDIIIHTILDLEQYLGKKVHWVSGDDFDDVIKNKGGLLPNLWQRYCTTAMKVEPIFKWWKKEINKPVIMNIGYRANEKRRADSMNSRLNNNGYVEHKTIIGKLSDGRNKWGVIEWQIPKFPLINDFIERQDIVKFWKDKPVRFAQYNNCVGCFHRRVSLLKEMSELHPEKFDWFIKQEEITKKTFKKDLKYQKIKDSNFTMSIPFNYDTEGCDSGFCGI